MNWITYSMMVPVDFRDLANRVAYIFDPDTGGAGTFSIQCSQSGQAPVTHFATSVPIQSDHAPLLSSPPDFYQAMLYLANLRGRVVDFTLEEVEALFSVLVISTEEFSGFLDGLGLQRIFPNISDQA